MEDADLIQLIAVPAIMVLVEGAKRLMKLAGMKRNMVAPVLSALLGIVYMYFRSTGAVMEISPVPVEADSLAVVVETAASGGTVDNLIHIVAGGTKLGAVASVGWKVLRPVFNKLF